MNRIKAGVTILTLLILIVPQALTARSSRNHVVQLEELHSNLVTDFSQRQANIEEVRTVLRNPQVQREVGKLVDLEKIDIAIESLDDETLAQLAEQSRDFNEQSATGVSSWVIVIAAAIALLVILLLI